MEAIGEAISEAERQLAVLERGCAEIIPRETLLSKLVGSVETGIPLRVKLGIDPTAKNVHIGHMVPYGKLRQFQDLGHRAVLIIGDYTASIGDPTGRNAERPPLTLEEVRENAESYARQIFTVVDETRAEIRYQSEWFSGLSLSELLCLTGSFSLAQLLAHETFRLRYEQGVRVGLHELMYPLLQAYDSVAVEADVELGGMDQKFNILCGRDLMRDRGLEAQCAMLMPLLPGLDGRKMSKSFGNDIPVSCGANEQFARLMAISDEYIPVYQELVLLDPTEALSAVRERIAAGENPVFLKRELASRIVERMNGPGSGKAAEDEWVRLFSKRETPEAMGEYRCETAVDVCRLLRECSLVASASEARRLVAEGAVYADEKRVSEAGFVFDPVDIPAGGSVVRIGRRRFVRVRGAKG